MPYVRFWVAVEELNSSYHKLVVLEHPRIWAGHLSPHVAEPASTSDLC